MRDTAINLPDTHEVAGLRVNKDSFALPATLDGCSTVPGLFRARCQELGAKTAHREKDLGIWQSYSWADYWTAAEQLAAGLTALGLKRGEVVSILSEDRKEWPYLDMAIQGLGAATSGIYTTDSANQLAYLLQDSASPILVVENDEQLDKFLKIESQVPLCRHVIVLDDDGLHDLSHEKCLMLGDLYALGQKTLSQDPKLFERAIDLVSPEDVALLIYTSGTTGKPKGAMLSQSNIIASLAAQASCMPVLPKDEQLCFLPLGHVFERGSSIFGPLAGKSTVNFAESIETVFDDAREVSPHVFNAVPRVWEKIYSSVLILRQEATPFGRWAFDRALKAGMIKAKAELEGKPVPALARLRYGFWDRMALHNLRRMLGFDRLRRAVSGAAPISPELLIWFRAIGVPIYEGYGMTENSAVCSVNRPGATRLGSVGQAIQGTQLRLSEQGEIQCRSLCVFPGYWNNPEKTAETFTEDGWLRTGDVGEIDGEGYLRITGRIKDIIITAGGKNITPSELESALKFSHYISDAVIIGDGRKYLTALIMIDQENVERFAQDEKVPFSNFASLCAAPEVNALIQGEVDKVNKQFARVEQVKKFRLINVLLTSEDEELTATMKLKRGQVEKAHKTLIDEMY
ncbi:MAG: long-chain fatty acid--CoA ligase [Mangrovicoccus sp.]|nr:long-chain fatty acid--CoA ligase [Mangrovicoccus sp.]